MTETELYLPIKVFLEAQGFTVKAEVRSCDVVALRGTEAPIIVEMKTALNLQLFYQAVDRLTITDHVYVAVPRSKRAIPSEAIKLCRRIGIGLMVVAASGSIDVLAEPVPYTPRQSPLRRGHLLSEFRRRLGDPNTGGSTRQKLMTAYRQDALRCALHLSQSGATRVKDIRLATSVERAATILRSNVYGWFQRELRGVYALTDAGRVALEGSRAHLQQLLNHNDNRLQTKREMTNENAQLG